MEDIHKEYGQSGIDNSPPVHPCLTTREDGQLILTCEEVQDEYTQGESNEEPVVMNWYDEHDHAGQQDKDSMQDDSFLKGQSNIQVEAVVVGHPVQSDTETVSMALEFPEEDFQERIKHFKTDLMLLKQRV